MSQVRADSGYDTPYVLGPRSTRCGSRISVNIWNFLRERLRCNRNRLNSRGKPRSDEKVTRLACGSSRFCFAMLYPIDARSCRREMARNGVADARFDDTARWADNCRVRRRLSGWSQVKFCNSCIRMYLQPEPNRGDWSRMTTARAKMREMWKLFSF